MPPPASLPLLLLLLLTLPRTPAIASCPSACYCDSQLSVTCNGDTLWSIPDDIPAGVRRLELRSFLVPSLTASQLAQFSNLTELKAQRNGISTIENGTFSALGQLVKLDLSQNALSQLTVGTLSGMSKTKNLDLSSNRLKSVEGAFVNLTSLEQLTLRSNNLTILRANTLKGLHKLQYLNLDSNRISEIDVSAFQPLASLAHLILSNNPLNNLSRLEFFGSRLQYIDVSAVGLSRVPQSLTQYVRDLRLAKNNLTVLRRGDFDSYPYLGLLVLDDCGIQLLEDDTLGRHEHLMRLWLNGNLLQNVPASLPVSLKAVYLEENQIRVLRQDDFSGLKALQQLFIQRNLIDTVEGCAFCGLSSLKNLDLQANKIQHLPADSFSGLTELESLDLSQNPIMELEPGSLAPLSSLKSLQLSRLKNNISVPDSLFDALEHLQKLEMFDSAPLVKRVINSGRLLHGIRSVTHLNVMHNQLVRLRSDLPQLLPQLQLLKLGGSWWNCSDPDILWLTDWMAEGRVQFYSPFSARCRQPPSLMLKSVALLTDGDFETVPTRSPTDAGSSITVPAVPTRTLPDTTRSKASTSPPGVATSTSPRPDPRVVVQGSTWDTRTTTTVSVSSTELETTASRPRSGINPYLIGDVGTPPISTTASPKREYPSTPPTASISSTSSTTTAPSAPAATQTSTITTKLEGPVPVASAAGAGRVEYMPTTSSRRISMALVLSSLAAAVGVMLLILAVAVALWRYRRGAVHPFTRRRKASSISYSQQKDEVNILEEDSGTTAEDGRCGAGAVRDTCNGSSHHGLTNALYFMSQSSGDRTPRPAALLDQPGVDACPRVVSDAWGTPSPDAAEW